MKLALLVLMLTLWPAGLVTGLSISAGEISAEETKLAATVTARLEEWQQKHTQPTNRVLHVVAWTPSDRAVPTDQAQRLTEILKDIQGFYATEMERNGFGPKSFPLSLDPEGLVVIHQVVGKHPESHYGNDSGHEIRSECAPILKAAGIDLEQETVALFCNLANWDEEKLTFQHHSPYYASGTWQRGFAWQLDSPQLSVDNLLKKTPIIHDRQYGRISLGKHNSIFIGGIAHELGHAFGLPHCAPWPEELRLGQPLMGSGNRTYRDELRGDGRGTFLNFPHALQLASHPLFCGRQADGGTREQRSQEQGSLSDLQINVEGKATFISGKLTSEPPAYAVLVYFDPEGNSDYNANCLASLTDSDGRFQVQAAALPPGKPGQVRIVPLLMNGAAVRNAQSPMMRFGYQVSAAGVPDFSTIQLRLELSEVISALQNRNPSLARKKAAALTHPQAADIAANLIAGENPDSPPAADQSELPTVSLTQYKAEVAKVGWLSPFINRVPAPDFLLESGGKIYTTGLYAHAPAVYEYSLGQKWATLAGDVGLATGHEGSVQFVISGDGRELWRSAVIRGHQTERFQIDLNGISQLKLETLPTEDGNAADWGLWLAPMLSR